MAKLHHFTDSATGRTGAEVLALGGLPVIQAAVLSSDFTVSESVALTPVTGMALPMDANSIYRVFFVGLPTGTGSGNGFRRSFTIPSGSIYGLWQDGTLGSFLQDISGQDIVRTTTTATSQVLFIGTVITGVTPGNIALLLASELSASGNSVTLLAGARLEIMKCTL